MIFELSTLISFAVGLVFGMVLFTLLYTVFFVRGLRIKPRLNAQNPMEEAELKQALKTSTEQMLLAQEDDGFFDAFVTASKDLTETIATYYYPTSKYPMMELSVDELLQLDDYIHDRIAQTLNKGLFKNVKHVRVTRFMELVDFKKKIDNQKWMKVVSDKRTRKGIEATLGVINAFNPVYWFRKLVIKTSISTLNRQIAKTMLAVVAEETSRVYSKSVFDETIDYDLVEREIKRLDEDLNDEDA
mgnify:CR=1 FL=1